MHTSKCAHWTVADCDKGEIKNSSQDSAKMAQYNSLLDMSLDSLVSVYDAIELSTGCLALLVGSFTAYVIVRHSSKDMKVYRWFLLADQVQQFRISEFWNCGNDNPKKEIFGFSSL